jgi:glutamyl-tRNA synthetase
VSVRVRYAPSPTGRLHPGNARTVLFDYLFARQQGGTFILRIEDTDQARKTEDALDSILDGIRWLGLDWDEGPGIGGPYGPYVQSERLSIYREHATRLVDAGDAYPCFCTAERLEAMRRQQQAEGRPSTRYDRRCLALPREEVEARLAAGEPSAIRMKMPEGPTRLKDLLRDLEPVDGRSQDDAVLLKSDGYPTYHLASVVDDHLMEISHVIRGDEWLGSFAKHLVLYRMFAWEPPIFVHVPVVLGPDRAKLSKRHGAAAVLEYRDMGYLPEAMDNFLALLGWSPGTEDDFFRLDELVQHFDLSRIQASPAVFDQAKLDSVNGRHIRALAPPELARALRPHVPDLSAALLEAAVPLVQERIQRLTDAEPLLRFLVHRPEGMPPELLPRTRELDEAAALEKAIGALQEARELFTASPLGPGLEQPLRGLAAERGLKAGDLFMMLRIALTGSRVTPPLLESAALLGPAECAVRLDFAVGDLVGRRR